MSGLDPATPRLRAIVDRAECFGFGFCADAVPAVFSLDAEGKSVAIDADVDPDLLVQAADTCPRSAISLVARDGIVEESQ